ncbi:MAG TPA: M48 family metallopeptidase [Lacipirellulaceae bacterium]|nr:M48 family metallopeptidase [Lacipirellulaceae bacterium]
MSGMGYYDQGNSGSYASPGSGFKARLIIALVIAAIAVISYYGRPGDENKITGKSERVAMSDEADEIRMGMAAKPEMIQQYGGVDPDPRAVAHVRQVGERLLDALDKTLAAEGRSNPYRKYFQFTLLGDPKTVNAFALPGGQIFMTEALYRDVETEGQLAGVVGHEIGHVIERHSNKQMAKQQLFQGLATAGGIAGGGDQQSAQMAQAVAQMVSMKYGRDDELEADRWGVKLTAMAGYDPHAMIGLMEVLEKASGSGAPPEFFSTHPNPAHREERIKEAIAQEFPNGLPAGLEK